MANDFDIREVAKCAIKHLQDPESFQTGGFFNKTSLDVPSKVQGYNNVLRERIIISDKCCAVGWMTKCAVENFGAVAADEHADVLTVVEEKIVDFGVSPAEIYNANDNEGREAVIKLLEEKFVNQV